MFFIKSTFSSNPTEWICLGTTFDIFGMTLSEKETEKYKYQCIAVQDSVRKHVHRKEDVSMTK